MAAAVPAAPGRPPPAPSGPARRGAGPGGRRGRRWAGRWGQRAPPLFLLPPPPQRWRRTWDRCSGIGRGLMSAGSRLVARRSPRAPTPAGVRRRGGPSSSPPPPLLAVPSLLPPFAIDRYQKLIPGTPPFRSSAALCSHGAAHGAARGDSPGGGRGGRGDGRLKLRGAAGFAAAPSLSLGDPLPSPLAMPVFSR